MAYSSADFSQMEIPSLKAQTVCPHLRPFCSSDFITFIRWVKPIDSTNTWASINDVPSNEG